MQLGQAPAADRGRMGGGGASAKPARTAPRLPTQAPLALGRGGAEPPRTPISILPSTARSMSRACAAGDSAFGCRQMIGNVWEWTASDFVPFAGFAADPYEDYSQPWFSTRKVLRGGSLATSARIARPRLPQFLHARAQRRHRRLPHLRIVEHVPGGTERRTRRVFPTRM